MTTPPATAHGGPNRNQGRRTLNRNTKTVRITITLTEAELAYLDRLSPLQPGGTRNHSEGVRSALRAHQRETKELLAEAKRRSDSSPMISDEELERDIAAKIAARAAVHVEN